MRQVIKTDKAPAAIGPYSQGIEFDSKLVFTSGPDPAGPQDRANGRRRHQGTDQTGAGEP